MPVFGTHPSELLQTVVEDIGVAMVVIDREERVVYANRMAHQLLDLTSLSEGVRFRDLRSKTRFEDSSGNEIPLAQSLVTLALKNKHVKSEEARFKAADGETKWVIGRVYRFSSLGLEGVAVFVVDETAEVEARKATALLERMDTIGTLAAELTHDFNNVLNTVMANIALVKEGGGCSPDAGDRLDQISDALNKSAGLIRRLTQFSRMQELHLRSLDVNDVVRDVVRLTKPLLRENIGLTLDLREDLPAVHGDSAQLEQLFVNLIVNALEAMPDGGDLTIATGVADGNQMDSVRNESIRQEKEEVVYISISDTGTGIPVEIESQIFEPFFTTKAEGKGLGLSSAFRIARSHGGKIEVHSLPGKGTEFTVSLPRINPAAGSLSEDFAKAS
jgi:PAS domain S-box-containing protein